MNLADFIKSPSRGEWVTEPGLEYYVKKFAYQPDVIILANVYRPCDYDEDILPVPGAYWRFIRRYASTIPFTAEQVFNKELAQFYERLSWKGFGMAGCAAYASPLTLSKYGNELWTHCYGNDEIPSKYIF